MGRLAVIGGTGVRESAFEAGAKPIVVDGVTLLDAGEFVILQRHGFDRYVRPHEIDHRANVLALIAAGCDRALGLSSTGSLRVDWPVGTFVCPDDFYAPQVSETVFDDARSHTVPGFDRPWRARLLETWAECAATPIIDGGTYAQTTGPRFETPSEVRALARVGDLVGMTIAAECILSKEVDLAYAGGVRRRQPGQRSGPRPVDARPVPRGGRGKPGRAARGSRYCAPGARRIRLMGLTITDATFDGEPVSLRAVNGIIDALGPDVTAEPGDETLAAGGQALTPALVNGHTHAAMTLFRGFGDDLPLMEWLEQRIWPAEANLTGADVYWGTRLACLEMIRSGTVRFWDMYWHQLDVARAVLDSGLRAFVGQPILEFEGAPEGARPEAAAEGIAALG